MSGTTATTATDGHNHNHFSSSPCPTLQQAIEAVNLDDLDDLSRQLREEALETARDEPALRPLLLQTVLAPGVRTFEDAVSTAITYRLLLRPCHTKPSSVENRLSNNNNGASSGGLVPPAFCPYSLRGIIAEALTRPSSESNAEPTIIREAGHILADAVRIDAQVVVDRDPAVDSLLEVVLFLKGFAALVCHRAAYYQWHTAKARRHKKSLVALWLQSQASSVFGLDIHPAATLGAGIMLDHGTGIVIGETATVGDGCTLLHGVTLGGTGKQAGADRHPKVGKDVLIGAGASLLGNIPIGDGAKIGAGSVVLRPIPAHATAVGAPAQIVGRAREAKPASTMDETLQQVHQIHSSTSQSTLTSTTASTTSQSVESDAAALEEFDDSGSLDEEVEEETKPETDEAPTDSPRENDEGRHKEKAPQSISHKHSRHKQSSRKMSQQTDLMCPFQQYTRMAALAPPNTITFCTLRQLLEPHGVPSSKIGAILFALDRRDVGYIRSKDLCTSEARQLLAEKTDLTPDSINTVLQGLEDRLAQPGQRRAKSVNIPSKPIHAASP